MNTVDVYEWLSRNKSTAQKVLDTTSAQEVQKLFENTGASTCDEAFSILCAGYKKYTLMNKDKPLTDFQVNNVLDVIDVQVLCPSPFDTDVKIRRILNQRKPAKNRAYLDKLLDLMQIKTITGYIDISYGLSLNDTLWFKPQNCDMNWSDINLYDNEFNEVIAHYAFSGQGLAGMHLRTTTPELGTNGALPKCWHREEDGQIYLYKGGTSGCANTGNEPYNEYMCSSILSTIDDIRFVPYSLKQYHKVLVSSCKLFTSKDIGYIPVCAYADITDFIDTFRLFQSLGFQSEFEDIMIFDALVYNTDRHLNNYGFLINNDTFEVLGVAPIYDNGNGLLPFYTLDKDIHLYAKEYDYQNFGLGNDDVIQFCIKTRHTKMLKSLIGFKFDTDPLFDMPAERVDALEKLLQQRIQYIIKES